MPRKPLFQPPVARGQPGWLVNMAHQLAGEEPPPPELQDRPKAGEKGWLVSMAEDMERGSLSSGGEITQSQSGLHEEGEQLSGKDGNIISTGLSTDSQNLESQKISQSQSQSSLTSSLEVLASDTVSSQIKALLSSQEVISKEIKSSQTLDIVTDTEQLLVTSDSNTVNEFIDTAVTAVQENSEPEKQNENDLGNTDEILDEVPAVDDVVTEEYIEDIDEVKPSASDNKEEFDSVKETSDISGLLDQILKKMDVEKMSQTVENNVSQSMKVETTKTSEEVSSELVTQVIAVKSKDPTYSVQSLVPDKITATNSQTKAATPEPVISAMSNSDATTDITSCQHQDEYTPDITPNDSQTEDCTKTKIEDVPSIASTYEHDKENIPNIASYQPLKATASIITKSPDKSLSIVCKPKKAYITSKLKDVPSSSKVATVPPKKRKKPTAKASFKRKRSISNNESREGGLFPVARKSRPNMKQWRSNKHGPESIISVRNELLALQRRRTAQTWVQCSLMECRRWRLLTEMDPCMVREHWQCSDNPDPKYGDCSIAEQEWTNSDMWVENRFTVGSLVMARTGGWPAWPAMVDDCPDTGDFFLNDVRPDGSWVPRPSKYHVVFFEKDAVSRAWVPDLKICKFDCTDINSGNKSSEKNNNKLQNALEMAKVAARESLLTRRSKYCLAKRFKGPWGTIWPFWEPQEDVRISPGAVNNVQVVDLDLETSRTSMDIEEQAVEMMPTEVSKDLLKTIRSANSRNVSLTDDNLLNDLLSDKKELQIEEAVKLAPPPARLDHLWQDSNLYTQEMSSKVNAIQDDPLSPVNASFQSDKDGLNASLGREIDEVVSSQTMVTPVKSKGLLQDKRTPTNSLLCLPSPKYQGRTSTPLSSHIIQSGVRLTSPLPSVLCSSPFPKYPLTPRLNPVLPSPMQSPVVGGCGDCSPVVKANILRSISVGGKTIGGDAASSSPMMNAGGLICGDGNRSMKSPTMGSTHKTPVKTPCSPLLRGAIRSPIVRGVPCSPMVGGALSSPTVGGGLRSLVVDGVPCSPGLQDVPCSPLVGGVCGSPSLSEGYKRLDVSRGSNAFSADGSFMEL